VRNKKIRAVAAVLAAALSLSARVCAAPGVSARSAVLLDAYTGDVLWEKNADEKSLIASTTKIMTGLLVAESGNLDRLVSVPPEAAGVEGSSLYLKAGEILTVRELLYGLMLQSGNDAAVTLAVRTEGGVERFVARMNSRARELGLTETHFANPNGLDSEENYSTARELARLACSAMDNAVFREVVSTRSFRAGGRSLSNHNRLLWSYEGAVGVKTGYTKNAGRLLVSAAERGGRRLVAVTVNAPDDWNDHAALLNYGFSLYHEVRLAEAGTLLGGTPVVGGTAAAVRCRAAQSASALVRCGEKPSVRICAPRLAFAPVAAGAAAGAAEFRLGNHTIASVPLRWNDSVPVRTELVRRNLFERLLGGTSCRRDCRS